MWSNNRNAISIAQLFVTAGQECKVGLNFDEFKRKLVVSSLRKLRAWNRGIELFEEIEKDKKTIIRMGRIMIRLEFRKL